MTSGESILLAAGDLAGAGQADFSEWDLTIAAWQRDPNRFGMRGHTHPDHKRVSCDLVTTRSGGPVAKGLLKRVRPSHYEITDIGWMAIKRLRHGQSLTRWFGNLHDIITHLCQSKAFAEWESDPGNPRDWSDVDLFSGEVDTRGSSEAMRDRIAEGIAWCAKRNVVALTSEYLPATPLATIASLGDFITAMEHRFPERMQQCGPQS